MPISMFAINMRRQTVIFTCQHLVCIDIARQRRPGSHGSANRVFAYAPYVELLGEATEPIG
jgi:hypothetical protein